MVDGSIDHHTLSARAHLTPIVRRGRNDYIQECQKNISKFKKMYPIHWIEYIRTGGRPANYRLLLDLKSRVRTTVDPEIGNYAALINELVDQKLHRCHHLHGVIVVAIVLKKLYVGYSLCNFVAGDCWNRSIGLWKAMQRITNLKIKPYPAVEAWSESAPGSGLDQVSLSSKTTLVELGEWLDQFPSSARDAAVRLTGRIFEQYTADK